MNDPDGDGVYCTTVLGVPAGDQNFKFFFAQEQWEDLNTMDACTVVDPIAPTDGVARTINVVAGVNQSVTYGWGVCEETCPAPGGADIEFCVDLSCFDVADAVAVAGTFNGFNPGVNFMADPDGDGVYCTTVADVPEGVQHFKFFFAQGQWEGLNGAGACAEFFPSPVDNFARPITVVAGEDQSVTFAWESCAPEAVCATTTDIELCVDLSCFPQVDAAAVAGQFNGFSPTEFLTDQGNGVYCTTVGLPAGDQEFKFFFAQEQFENFGPEDAACTANGNRVITVVEGQQESYTFGWERCDDQCILPGADVNFCVNVGCSGLDPNTVNIFGQFNGFTPTANPLADQGNGIWCGTVFLPTGPQEYLFLADGVAEAFQPGTSCTVTNFGFTNRIINIVDGQDQTVNFDWEECTFTSPSEGWSYADVTANTGSGSANFNSCDIGSRQVTIDYTATTGYSGIDNHGFTSTTLCGDGEISFRVVNVSSGAYIGPTLRETLSPASKQVSVFSNMTNVLRWETRYATNGPLTVQSHYRPAPFWLRLIRQGNWIFGYYSFNGSSWSYVHAVNVSMDNCIEAGVSLWSYLPNVPSSGTVDNVSVIEYGNNSYNLSRPEISSNGVQAGEWELFPNPATDELSVRWDVEAAPTRMTIFNESGQLIRSQVLDRGPNSLDLRIDDLVSGAYWIEMRNEQQRLKVLPFVKQ